MLWIFDLVVRVWICIHRIEVIEIDRTDRKWKSYNHEVLLTTRPPIKIMDVDHRLVVYSRPLHAAILQSTSCDPEAAEVTAWNLLLEFQMSVHCARLCSPRTPGAQVNVVLIWIIECTSSLVQARRSFIL